MSVATSPNGQPSVYATIAQDFRSVLDEQGAEVERLRKRNRELRAELAELRHQNAELRRRLAERPAESAPVPAAPPVKPHPRPPLSVVAPREWPAPGRLRIDYTMVRATVDGRDLLLAAKEFSLLAVLIERGRECTGQELQLAVWGYLSVRHDTQRSAAHNASVGFTRLRARFSAAGLDPDAYVRRLPGPPRAPRYAVVAEVLP